MERGFWENGKGGESGIVVSLRLLLQAQGRIGGSNKRKTCTGSNEVRGNWEGEGDIDVRVSTIKAQCGGP